MNIAIILIILLVGAILTYFSGNKFASKVAMLFSTAAAIFSVGLLLKYGVDGAEFSVQWISNPEIYFSLKVDGISLAMALLTTFLTPIIIFASLSTEFKNEKALYSLVLFMEMAMLGSFLSSNALLYYVFWEMSLIPIYFIIIQWGNDEVRKRRRAAMTFFLYTFMGSLFMLAGIIFMYVKTGSFELDAFVNADLTLTEQLCVFVTFFLAYGIKIPIFPFHTWQANVYQKAPTIGTMLLAGLMSKMGAYGIIRWQLAAAPDAALQLQPFVITLCIVGVLYGAIIALRQEDLKKFLAYASLSHVGFLAAGAYALTFDGIQGSIILIVAHGFGIVGLFHAADVIYRRTGTLKIKELGGFQNYAPRFAVSFLIMILASIAIPFSFNFVGEFTIMYGLYQVNILYAVLIGFSMFMGAFFMLRMYQQVMLGPPQSAKFKDLGVNEFVVFTLIMAVILFFGVYTTPVSELIAPSVQEIINSINR